MTVLNATSMWNPKVIAGHPPKKMEFLLLGFFIAY